jgi:hypothetical protein
MTERYVDASVIVKLALKGEPLRQRVCDIAEQFNPLRVRQSATNPAACETAARSIPE